MPKHFHGAVSRFSAGARGAVDEQKVIFLLQQGGVSILGTHQFVHGDIVSNPADRQRLAGMAGVLLDLKAGQKVSEGALPLSAAQAAREAARSKQELAELGISAAGAHQFIIGLHVTGAEDRRRLTEVFYAILGPGAGLRKDMVLKGKKILEN